MTDTPDPKDKESHAREMPHASSSDPKATSDGKSFSASAQAASEGLFVMLPMIVLSIVMMHNGDGIWALLSTPEWSIASSVFFGLSIVKMVGGFAVYYQRLKYHNVMLLIAIVIVFGLVPSLVVLSLILVTDIVSLTLIILQAIIFLLSAFTFLFLGSVGILLLQDGLRKEVRAK